MIKKHGGVISPCTTGEHPPFLVYFGLGKYPRVKAAFAENHTRDYSYRGFVWPHWSNLTQNEFNETLREQCLSMGCRFKMQLCD